jgi:hypothetical protein
VATLVWIATLSSVTVPELGIAIALSIPCGILARLGRRALEASWRFRLRWLGWPVPVVASLVAELGKLFLLAASSPHDGELTEIPLPTEPRELARGRAAVATFALCSTPGSLVVDTDLDRNRLVVHELLSAGPDLAEVVQR